MPSSQQSQAAGHSNRECMMSPKPLEKNPSPRSNVSGSEKRQRAKARPVRFTAEEDEKVMAKVQAAGLSFGAYMRALALGEPGPRAKRSPPVDAELLARAVAQLNKAGSNLNQIAKAANSNQIPSAAFNLETLAQVRLAVAEIRIAVGRKERP